MLCNYPKYYSTGEVVKLYQIITVTESAKQLFKIMKEIFFATFKFWNESSGFISSGYLDYE